MPDILHITPRAKWEQAGIEGDCRGDTLATEGFLRCCTSDQIAGVYGRYVRGQTDLLLLRINPERLAPPLNWESPPGSEVVSPHLYGPLNLDAVVEIVTLAAVLSGAMRWS